MRKVAALFVQKGGVYYGVEGCDPWDEERDARKYLGPYPVVAHPPCARWCRLAESVYARCGEGYEVGNDGGCFGAALKSVKRFGGVLEHPAQTKAWEHFGLMKPVRDKWSQDRWGNWVTEVSQRAYGHKARKNTWLFYVGPKPFDLDWSRPEPEAAVGYDSKKPQYLPKLSPKENLATPLAFRDVLLDLARLSVAER